jgi:2-haloacid dehalogenase
VTRWATFDCYGTLVDWNGGVSVALTGLWPARDVTELLHRYHEVEPQVQRAEPTAAYREVLRRCLVGIAEAESLELAVADEGALGDALPSWPAFPEVRAALTDARARGWRLCILSNTDTDLLAASIRQIGAAFDETVVASQIGSYKPAHRHWEEFFARTGADRERHVHVAASLFHDIAPANELGLRSVWIDRLGETPAPGQQPTRRLTDLEGLADVLDGLVAP